MGDSENFPFYKTHPSDDTLRSSKGLCHGSFQYLPGDKAKNVLILVQQCFPHVERTEAEFAAWPG